MRGALAAVFTAMVLAAAGRAQAQAQAMDPAVSSAAPFGMPIHDDRVYVHALLDQLEGRLGDGRNAFRWEGEGWIGTDTNRLWLKSEGETQRGGRVADGDQELLYDRPVTTYFDLQAGARYDLDGRPGRGWAALGVEGFAPYFFTVSATAYASDTGHYAAKLEASNDIRFTQRLILEPQAELNLYSRSDPARRVGSGLCDLDAGLRLRYELDRKLAPYVGVNYERLFGRAGAYARSDGDSAQAVRLTLGVRSWF